jgi:8-oxo-dGTP pyrophosphatase MutT (NUDIX family)
MSTERIRPIVIGIIRRSGCSRRDDQILVFESRERDTQGQVFYRPLGGSIEFGEHGDQALVRELREEIGAEIENVRYLGLRENLFQSPSGERAHEIVLVFEADLADKTLYEKEEMVAVEDSGAVFRVLWQPLAFFQRGEAPLYPNGLLEMLLDPEAAG